MNFDYDTAFSRNIGWITKEEQEILRTKRIAIAGMGGVGGSHLLTLTRLGIGKFHIADFDTFELVNFNRQAGALVSHLGHPKVDVLADMACEINPDLEIKKFPEGVNEHNVSEFFTPVDCYVDGLDFFALKARQSVFAACTEMEIPGVTVAPLGMGAALLNFLPGKMTFEEYFCLKNQPENEQIIRFLLGLSPAMLQRAYLVDESAVDLINNRGPSTPMACELCAGLAATQVLKILLRRGPVLAAPRGLQFDAYRNRLIQTWRPWGNSNPIQRLGLKIARKQFMDQRKPCNLSSKNEKPNTVIEEILECARWAPSGDNTQPWRFEIINDQHFVVHGYDTREHCVYDLQGRSSQMALGALLETISIAASGHGLKANSKLRAEYPETSPTVDISLTADKSVQPDTLRPYIPIRSVQRRSMETRPLSVREKENLENAVGKDYSIVWLEGWNNRFKTAWLMFKNGKLRLTMPEAYEVHKSVIEWNARYSEDKIPDQAIGLDPITTKMMKWVMGSWTRVRIFNTIMGGTILPRLELDLIPGINCGAHFVLISAQKPEIIDDYLAAGRAMQRFWLTGTKLGLQLQPEMTPLIFSSYIREGIQFTKSKKLEDMSRKLSMQLQELISKRQFQHAVFMGRVGEGPTANSRSIRLSLEKLRKI